MVSADTLPLRCTGLLYLAVHTVTPMQAPCLNPIGRTGLLPHVAYQAPKPGRHLALGNVNCL
jgi:hypothetical protein